TPNTNPKRERGRAWIGDAAQPSPHLVARRLSEGPPRATSPTQPGLPTPSVAHTFGRQDRTTPYQPAAPARPYIEARPHPHRRVPPRRRTGRPSTSPHPRPFALRSWGMHARLAEEVELPHANAYAAGRGAVERPGQIMSGDTARCFFRNMIVWPRE